MHNKLKFWSQFRNNNGLSPLPSRPFTFIILVSLCPFMMMTLSFYWSSYALGARAPTESHRSQRTHQFCCVSKIFPRRRFSEREPERKIEEINQTMNHLPVEAHYILHSLHFLLLSVLELCKIVIDFYCFFFSFGRRKLIQMSNRIELFTISY